MLVEHRGSRPSVDPTAYVAPNAVLCAGLPRDAPARERMEHQTEWFGAHRDDRIIE